MKLELNGIEVNCIIGDRPEDRVRPQLLLVDVELTVPDIAADTDCLKDTVDYVKSFRTRGSILLHRQACQWRRQNGAHSQRAASEDEVPGEGRCGRRFPEGNSLPPQRPAIAWMDIFRSIIWPFRLSRVHS